MESALYGIYALVVFVSEILLVRCAHSFDFWYVNNSCVNTIRQHFPWSILYVKKLHGQDGFFHKLCKSSFAEAYFKLKSSLGQFSK